MVINETSRGFWKEKRVLLTGHTGFKGCWLLLWLETLGAEIFGCSLPPAEPSLFNAAIKDDTKYGIFADIRDAERLTREMARFAPEIVFHLAAQPLVRESYREPGKTYETNVMGTVNLLEAVRQTGTVKSLVVITTDKCYRDMGWEWGYRETDSLGGADPYSSSKACVELLCDAWRRSFFKDGDTLLATARAGNVIGGGDWAPDRIVPDAIRAFQSGGTLEIRSPNAVRPWQHVLEPLYGYLTLAERLYNGDRSCEAAWNFGPSSDESRNVRSLVERLSALWGEGAKYTVKPDNSLHESHSLRLDSSRAIQNLAWRPRLGFEEALSMTVGWYRRVFNGEDSLSLTQNQISKYMES
jgi:CDP-glucose 4,6-dehydratase